MNNCHRYTYSNLDSKKARGSSLKPWSFLQNPQDFLEMVPLYKLARQFFQGTPSV